MTTDAPYPERRHLIPRTGRPTVDDRDYHCPQFLARVLHEANADTLGPPHQPSITPEGFKAAMDSHKGEDGE